MKAYSFLSQGFSGLLRVAGNALFGKCRPLVGGIAITDRCNLHCLQCAVSNRGMPDMGLDEILTGLKRLREMGIRALFVEGGEPFLWQDGENELEDVVANARIMGFRSIVVYTNGTFPIETSADAVFVSLDGLKHTNDRLRGKSYDAVVSNIKDSPHPKLLINFTINRTNEPEIEPFCDEVSRIDHIRGVFFYFYTPYRGADDFFLDREERAGVIERILRLKSTGCRILNSAAALRGVRDDTWDRPTSLCYLYADNRLYRCCRHIGNEDTCRNCGYLGYAELHFMARLRPSAILSAARCL